MKTKTRSALHTYLTALTLLAVTIGLTSLLALGQEGGALIVLFVGMLALYGVSFLNPDPPVAPTPPQKAPEDPCKVTATFTTPTEQHTLTSSCSCGKATLVWDVKKS